MFKSTDTARAHALARATAPAFPSYRAAYAVAAAHVAGSKRAALTVRPAPTAAAHVRYWTAAIAVVVGAWMTCPAVAAAAN